MTCQHGKFRANVRVTSLEGVEGFTADITISCAECGEPFRFLGVEAGSSPHFPRVSVDGLELRAPIAPQGMPTRATKATFDVSSRPAYFPPVLTSTLPSGTKFYRVSSHDPSASGVSVVVSDGVIYCQSCGSANCIHAHMVGAHGGGKTKDA